MENIKKTIDKKVNPLLKLHNGSCEAVSFENGVLFVNLHGGCAGCPSSALTLLGLITPVLQEDHPEISIVTLNFEDKDGN